jgi:hypothetical protein
MKPIVFLAAFIIGVVVAAPARTSDKLAGAVAQDGSYRVGSCNVIVNHFEGQPSKVGIGVIKYSKTDDSAQSYIEYDAKTQEGSCVFFMSDRFKAHVDVQDNGDYKTITLKCGGFFSQEDGTATVTIDKKTGKVFSAAQNLRYARYAGQTVTLPFFKDEAPSLDCHTDKTQFAAADESVGDDD